MGDATLLICLSPETTYATKPNILRPGSQADADAAEVRADARIEDALADGVTIAGLSIEANGE